MSETEDRRAYYAAAEAAFIRRRGTPFLLSPRDFALLKEWRALGVPLEAGEAGIDAAFPPAVGRPARGGGGARGRGVPPPRGTPRGRTRQLPVLLPGRGARGLGETRGD